MLEDNVGKMARILEASGVGLWELNLDTKESLWTPEVFRMFGHASHQESIPFGTILEAIHPDDRDTVERAVAGADATKIDVEYRIIRGDGEVRVLRAQAAVELTTEPASIIGTLQDITEQKRYQQALLETKHLFQLVSENSQDIISVSTPDRICRYVSPSIRGLLGYEPEEFIGQSLGAFFHPDDRAYVNRIVERIAQGEDINRFTSRVRCKDGHYLWYETTLKVNRDEQGRIQDVVGIGRDVSEQVKLQASLEQAVRSAEESRERYRRLIDNSLNAIGIFEHGKWLFMNRTGLQMFGATKEEEVVGRSAYDFLHPDYHEECKRRVRMMMSGQPVPVAEQKWIRLDGSEFHAEVLGTPYSETAVQVILRDITDRKQAELTMMNAEKLTAVGQLAAGIAHEIRNPLTSLVGFTQILREQAGPGAGQYFDIMRAELNRIEAILTELLVLAKPQAMQVQPADIGALLHEVTTLIEPQAMIHNVIIETRAKAQVPLVECDPNQLKQVFINVIKNAIEAMPQGGQVSIKLTHQPEGVCIEFADTGQGISKERLAHLGTPFYSTKEKGTGLGFMLSRKIIESHGGSIHIDSEVGKGTTVLIVLPSFDGATTSNPAADRG